MKTIALVLALLLAVPQAWSQEKKTTWEVNEPGQPQAWICFLVIGAALAGAFIVIYASVNSDKCKGPATLVLEKDNYDGVWVFVQSRVVTVSTNKLEVFRDLRTDVACRYRVKVYPPPDNAP